jgi:phosphatidylglycerophosphatase A
VDGDYDPTSQNRDVGHPVDSGSTSVRQIVPEMAHRTRWAWAVGTVCGVGWLKPGPGTYASAVAGALWFVAAHASGLAAMGMAAATAVAALAAMVVGIPAATIVAREAGREDPGFVVIDEVAGQWIALIAVRPDVLHAVLALALFRLFDIWKPWPVRNLERLPGGTGIMLDDVAAGALALAVGLLLARWV